MNKSKIEWTDFSWNPVTGCSRVSDGCRNCYAEAIAKRFGGRSYPEYRDWSARNAAHNVVLHLDRLDQPMRMRKPRKIFVNSMSDLFHEWIPDTFIAEVFSVMEACSKHQFIILTKRAKRMKEIIDAMTPPNSLIPFSNWPLPNVLLGVSCEDQNTADERIPLLLQTPAAHRIVSAEPLLEGVSLRKHHVDYLEGWGTIASHDAEWTHNEDGSCKTCPVLEQSQTEKIGLVIVGGESGRNARPCNIEWIRDIVRQCKEAETKCFVKQVGSNSINGYRCFGDNCQHGGRICLKDSKGGDSAEWPEDIRVREWIDG